MLNAYEIFWFALAALVLGLTPGPNMAYCLSRTLSQGRLAGLICLAGVLAAYGVHVTSAALGLTALLIASETAFNAVKLTGAVYLLWLAWHVLRPSAIAALSWRSMNPAPTSALFCMGFLVNLLNPKVALFYVALLPQFLRPDRGALMTQSFQLGAVQIAMSAAVMGLLVFGVSRLQPLFTHQDQAWQRAVRYFISGVFAALAIRILTIRLT